MTEHRRDMRCARLGSLLTFVGLGVVFACGSDDAPSQTPGGAADGGGVADEGGAATACGPTVRAGLACSAAEPCCSVPVPDGFGPEGYRCTAGAWTADPTCLPAPAACASPLDGTLSRADASGVDVTCFGRGDRNGVASIALTLEGTGEIVEVYFDRAPAAGEALDVIAHTEGPRPDGGSQNRASLRVGRPGGFSGFDVTATSVSGKLTVVSIEATSATVITSLHASVDVVMSGAAPWAGKLTGSW